METDLNLSTKYQSSPNIAWVKYWGKYDEQYILPINDSLGLTLSQDDICTITQINFSTNNSSHQLLLNGQSHPISKRMNKMFQIILEKAYKQFYFQTISKDQFYLHHFKITSNNSFPTASGMASSASGLACLAAAVNGLFGNILSDEQLSELARLGSGSASRSVWGGLVHWQGVPKQILQKGQKQKNQQLLQEMSKRCISRSVIDQNKLQKIKVIILLANNKKKQISSTSGMQTSVKTSSLIEYRNKVAKERCNYILQTLQKLNSTKNTKEYQQSYNAIIQTIIKDSNQFHAICLDTYPPIFYLNQFSKQVISIVDHILNPNINYKVAYTFDAGPHAFLFVHEEAFQQVLRYFVNLYNWFQQKDKFNTKGYNQVCRIKKQIDNKNTFKQFQGQIILPYQIWVTQGGHGAKKLC